MLINNLSQKFIDRLLKYSWTEKSRHEFRVSKFPYCPILDLEDHNIADMQEDYSKLHYTTIGSATHANIQKIKPLVKDLGPLVYGRWKCEKCNKISEMGFHKEERLKVVKKCKEECPKRFIYEEIDFKYQGILSGHLDLLFKNPDTPFFVSEEYKTTGSKLFAPNSYLAKFYPVPKHFWQIKIYSTLLRILYGIKASHYNIVYFNRDKPEAKVYTYPFTEKDFKNVKEKIDLAIKGRTAVNRWLKTKDEKYLKRIVKYKPCTSQETFMSYMKAYFFGKEVCPHLKTCLKKPNSVVKSIVKAGLKND